jgi:GDP/UDP-N,N'-diacetylbacillosamine 2-epimerase (hydrolysing)
MSVKRKIIAVSGARSEYDLMSSIYKTLQNDTRFNFGIIITGPHLSPTYGLTAHQIENDGLKIIDKIYNFIDSNEKITRVISIGNQITQLGYVLEREKPDIVLVCGDREESITVTLVCAHLNIAVAHFFGGDIAKDGNIDNSVRYAASKFAHIHFPAIEEHKQTLLKLGEVSENIFVVGNPAIERFITEEQLSKNKLSKRLNCSDDFLNDYCVLIQHPIITELAHQKEHITITLDSILKSNQKCFINYPNSDAGSLDIIKVINEFASNHRDKFHLFKNLDRTTYVNLLRNAQYLIGNSSSGLLEAPSIGLPAINIGSRQRDRIHGDNVIFVNNVESEILEAIQKVLFDIDFITKVNNKNNPYGDGNTTTKVVDILATIEINQTLIHKNITY